MEKMKINDDIFDDEEVKAFLDDVMPVGVRESFVMTSFTPYGEEIFAGEYPDLSSAVNQATTGYDYFFIQHQLCFEDMVLVSNDGLTFRDNKLKNEASEEFPFKRLSELEMVGGSSSLYRLHKKTIREEFEDYYNKLNQEEVIDKSLKNEMEEEIHILEKILLSDDNMYIDENYVIGYKDERFQLFYLDSENKYIEYEVTVMRLDGSYSMEERLSTVTSSKDNPQHMSDEDVKITFKRIFDVMKEKNANEIVERVDGLNYKYDVIEINNQEVKQNNYEEDYIHLLEYEKIEDYLKYWDMKQLVSLYDYVAYETSSFEWINDYKDDDGYFLDDNYNDEINVEEMVEKCQENISTLAKVIVDNNIDLKNYNRDLTEQEYQDVIKFLKCSYEDYKIEKDKIIYYSDMDDLIGYPPKDYYSYKALYYHKFAYRLAPELEIIKYIDDLHRYVSPKTCENLATQNSKFHKEYIRLLQQLEENKELDLDNDGVPDRIDIDDTRNSVQDVKDLDIIKNSASKELEEENNVVKKRKSLRR